MKPDSSSKPLATDRAGETLVGAGAAPPTHPLARRSFLAGLLAAGCHVVVGCGGGADDAQAATGGAQDGGAADGAAGPLDYGDVGALAAASTFAAAWTTSLVPEVGPMPTWLVSAAAGTPTVRDAYGVLRRCRLGEARFSGARRVENKMRASADLRLGAQWFTVGVLGSQMLSQDSSSPDSTGAFRAHRLTKSATQSALVQAVGVLPATPHTFSIHARAGSLSQVFIQLYVSGGTVIASGLFDVPASGWRRVQITGTPDGTSPCRVLISPGPFNGATAGDVLVCDVQLEDVSGLPTTTASEYVATERPNMPAWYYGAMVDGVRYFATANGNTAAGGVVTAGTGAALAEDVLSGLLIEPETTNLCTQTASFANWARSSAALVVTPRAAPAPTREAEATRLREGADVAAKLVSQTVGPFVAGSPVTVSCFAKAESASWFRLQLAMSDGRSIGAYFDLANGAVGSVAAPSGVRAWAHIEAYAGGWWRCVLTSSAPSGAASTVGVQLGIGLGDGVGWYGGNNRSLLVWGAQAVASEFAGSCVPNPTEAAVTRAAYSVQVENASGGVIGLQDFVVKMDVVPAYYTGVTNKGGATPAWRAFWYAFASGAYRNQHRLGLGLRPTSVAFFGDRYLGDPNPLYFWAPGRSYPAGAIVIPTDTLLDNANARRMFVAVQAGVSGTTEPMWDTRFVATPDTTTAVTRDGSVVWQNNHDNTIQGQWEPYDTSVLEAGFSAFAAVAQAGATRTAVAATRRMRLSTFSAPGAYGYAVNGQNARLRTTPFPIDGSSAGDLHYPMESIRFGRLTEGATAHPLQISFVYVIAARIGAEQNRLLTVP